MMPTRGLTLDLKQVGRPRPAWRLGDLLASFATPGVDPSCAGAVVSGLALDSRRIQAGGLFLACRGGQGHGLDFAQQVRSRGATAIAAEPAGPWEQAAMTDLAANLGLPVIPVPELRRQASQLADRFFGEPSAHLQVMGVTGTNGKTSVTHYLAQALTGAVSCGLIGTLGTGFPGDLTPASHTTPDPVCLQETLAWLREQGAGAVAMEVSSHALARGWTAGVRFSHAILTNLSRDHLDYHGDMASYVLAMRSLFRAPGLEWAILNLDDPLGTEILGDLTANVRIGGYSLNAAMAIPEACDLWVRPSRIVPIPGGMRLELETNAGPGSLELGLIGRFNAANVMAVLLVLLSRGMAMEQALRTLEGVHGVPGRLEGFCGGGSPLVVVDYAHTPDALEQALLNLRPHLQGRLTCVFGCGGNRDVGKRPLMGAIAEHLADHVILTDDNPRREDGDDIITQILGGMAHPARVVIERRRGMAIRRAIASAGRDDLVLVAGKGHETIQDLGDRQVHFSDRAQVQQALNERSGTRHLGSRKALTVEPA